MSCPSKILFLFILNAQFLFGFVGKVTFDKGDLRFSKKLGYDFISLGDLPYTTEKGKPALPYKIVNVAIPDGFTVRGVVVRDVKAEEIQGEYLLMPVQPPVTTENRMEIPLIPPDRAVYNSSELYPDESIRLLGVGDIAGQRIARLQFFPVRYLPRRRKIVFQSEIDFEVLTERGERARRIKLTERTRPFYESLIKSLVVNPGEVRLRPGDEKSLVLPPGDYEYVVIAPINLQIAFYPLINWKIKKGIQSNVVTTSWIFNNYEGADGAEKIRNFIQDANETWGAVWFLLGGDAEYIPVKSRYYVGEWVPGDYYYSDYDDDWLSEVFVGRVPAENLSQVQIFVDKVLHYEREPSPEYLSRVLFIGMDLDQWTPSEELKETIESDYVLSFFDVMEVYDSQGGNHREIALNALNSGQHIVNHSDHSDWDELGVGYVNHEWRLYEADIDDLTNYGRPSIFYSLGCWSCAFDGDEDCIGEHFVVYNPNKAGVAYLGNTRYGWYNYGNIFVYSGKMDLEWWRSLMVLGRRRLGEILADSKNRNYPVDDYYRYIYQELTLLGDPEMPVWTGYLGEIEAEFDDTISPGYRDFTVTVMSGGSPLDSALVCLYKGGEVYVTGLTGADGNVTFQIDPETDGILYVTATKYNYRPFEGHSLVLQCVPGDANGDGLVSASDIAFLANYLYSAGPQPSTCGDVNGDCHVNNADLIFLVNYLYWGGESPRLPCSNRSGLNARKE